MITVHTNDTAYTLSAPPQSCTLHALLREAGVSLPAPCGGMGRCGNCRVRAAGDLSAPDAEERAKLGDAAIADGIRLACRARVIGETVEIWLDMPSQLAAPQQGSVRLDPVRPLGTRHGLAIDLGTTTIAAALYDLASGELLAEQTVRNPQASFGADVISRLMAAGSNASVLADTAKAAIRQLAEEFCKTAELSSLPDAAVLTANTAMLCLLFGYPVQTLSRAPFALPHAFGEERPLSELLPDASGTLYIPPCIGPFLGADIVTAMLDTTLTHAERPTALLDLGTNGEIALFDGTTAVCCSTAAGPAFEGAGIRMGCGAAAGAIDRVVRDGSSVRCHTVADLPAIGLCASGLTDAIACLLDTGAIQCSGRLTEGDRIRLGDTDVFLYQSDIRAVQSAKAAIRAGLSMLTEHTGIDDPDLLLAGGFGSALNIKSAARIGLIPEDAVSRTRAVGNAALQGAAKLLMDRELANECRMIAENAVCIDLASDPNFSERYIDCMLF